MKRKYAHLMTTVGKPYPKAWIIGKTLKEIEHELSKVIRDTDLHHPPVDDRARKATGITDTRTG
jgi:hypothetical protein